MEAADLDDRSANRPEGSTIHGTVDRAEAVIVTFRRHTLLPLDDWLYALQASIPHLTRPSLHRCLQRHGISQLRQHLGDFVAAYNFARRLNTLKGLTPYEAGGYRGTMLAHVPWAIGIQLVGWAIGYALGVRARAAIWLGWFAAAVLCVTREVTQREYQWIEAYGHGLRRNMPDLAGFRVWEWNAHSISETVAAIGAATLLALIVTWKSRA